MPPRRPRNRRTVLAATAILALALLALLGRAWVRGGYHLSRTAPLATARPATPTPAPGHVRVAGVVLPWVRGDPAANLARLAPLVREAAANGAQLVVTSEAALDGYAVSLAVFEGLSDEALRARATRVPGGARFAALADLAREAEVHLVAGLLEADGDRLHNTAVLLGPDGALLGRYRKRSLGWEAPRIAPGDGPRAFDTDLGRVGLLVCADRTERELVADTAALGVDLLVCPSGGSWGPRANDRIVQVRSWETGLPIVFVHPAELLVTTGDGAIAARSPLGERTFVEPGGEDDGGAVYYHDLAPGPHTPGGPR